MCIVMISYFVIFVFLWVFLMNLFIYSVEALPFCFASRQNKLNEHTSGFHFFVIFTLKQQKSAPSFRHDFDTLVSNKRTMQINIVLQGRVRNAVIKLLQSTMYFSNPQLFYTISFICAFLYACLFKYELVSSVILTMKTISSVLWLMQLLESYWIFLHSMN